MAPVKSQTIPRLELIAALLTFRLLMRVKIALESVLEITGIYCWTDSMVVYHWITQEERDFQQLVENRIADIRQLSPPAWWNHCPGQSSPDDIPTTLRTLEISKVFGDYGGESLVSAEIHIWGDRNWGLLYWSQFSVKVLNVNKIVSTAHARGSPIPVR